MTDQNDVPVTNADRERIREALHTSLVQQEQVQEELDASLEDGVPCDACGVPGHSFEDCPEEDKIMEELSSRATVSQDYQQRQNSHAALEMAIKVVTAPHSPFRTERASADEIVTYAKVFRDFLNG